MTKTRPWLIERTMLIMFKISCYVITETEFFMLKYIIMLGSLFFLSLIRVYIQQQKPMIVQVFIIQVSQNKVCEILGS